MARRQTAQRVMGAFAATAAVAMVTLLATGNSARAAVVWDGGGANTNWATAANWAGDVAPANTADTEFGSSAAQTTIGISAGNKQANSVTFTSGALPYTFSGSSLLFLNAITVNAGVSNNQAFDCPLWVYASLNISHGGTGSLSLNLKSYRLANDTAAAVISGSGSGTITNFVMQAATGYRAPTLTLNGSGTWTVPGTFDFALGSVVAARPSVISVNGGTLDVSAMTLRFNANGTVSDPSYTLINYSGGTLNVNGSSVFGSVTNLPTGYRIENDTTSRLVKLVVVPEPASMAALMLAGLALACRRRRV